MLAISKIKNFQHMKRVINKPRVNKQNAVHIRELLLHNFCPVLTCCLAKSPHLMNSSKASSNCNRPFLTQLEILSIRNKCLWSGCVHGKMAVFLLEVSVQFPLDVVKGICSHVISLALLPPLLPFFWGHKRLCCRRALPKGQMRYSSWDAFHI